MKKKIKELINGIKKYINNIKLKRYYIENTMEGRSYFAIFLDSLVIKVILFILGFIYFFIRTNSLGFTATITVQLILLFWIINGRIKKSRLNTAKKEVYDKVAKEKIFGDLINKTPYEYLSYLKSALEKYKVEDIKLFHQTDVDMLANLDGNRIGIKCYQYNKDYKVSSNHVREFFLTLNKMDINEGIIITTSTFSEDAKELLPKLKDHGKLHLMDIEEIVKLFKQVELYPSDNDIKKIILDKISDKKRRMKEYKNEILSKSKIGKYIIIGLVIYLWGGFTPFETYYNLVALILILLAIISFGKYISSFIYVDSANEEEIL